MWLEFPTATSFVQMSAMQAELSLNTDTNMLQNYTSSKFLTSSSKAALMGIAGMLIVGFSTPVFAQENKVVAKVGAMEITMGDLDQAVRDLAQQLKDVPEAQRKARALDTLVDIFSLAQKAEAEGLEKDPETKRQLALLRARALHNSYFQKNIRPTVSEDAVKQRYDKEVVGAERQVEVSARHILVKTEEEAKAIIKELEGGADFIELAKAKSTGPSGANGGDLGYFGAGKMVPAFEKAAFALEKGAFTKEAVKTQFGYHIIKAEDKREQPAPAYEQVKSQIQQLLMTEAYAAAIKKTREDIGVEIMDEGLKVPENN